MIFIQKEKSVFVTTEEPLKTGIGSYGPHLIRLLHGSQKQTVYHGSQVTSHHSCAFDGALIYYKKLHNSAWLS